MQADTPNRPLKPHLPPSSSDSSPHPVQTPNPTPNYQKKPPTCVSQPPSSSSSSASQPSPSPKPTNASAASAAPKPTAPSTLSAASPDASSSRPSTLGLEKKTQDRVSLARGLPATVVGASGFRRGFVGRSFLACVAGRSRVGNMGIGIVSIGIFLMTHLEVLYS